MSRSNSHKQIYFNQSNKIRKSKRGGSGINSQGKVKPHKKKKNWMESYSSENKFFQRTKIHHESESCSVVSDSLWPHGLHSPWSSPGQNTGGVSLSLLQGIFPTQGSNPGLPHCRRILYQLSHQGSPKILEWGAYPFSSRSSWPRDQTGVSCIAGGFSPTELSGKPNI